MACASLYLGISSGALAQDLVNYSRLAHTRLRKRTLSAMARASKGQTNQGRHCDNSDDIIWDRRHRHRCAGVASAHRSADVIQMLILISTEELPPEEEPMPPDPFDRNLSKRQWERSTGMELSIMEGLEVYCRLFFSQSLVRPSLNFPSMVCKCGEPR